MGGESEGEGKQENEAKKKVDGLPHREVGGRGRKRRGAEEQEKDPRRRRRGKEEKNRTIGGEE